MIPNDLFIAEVLDTDLGCRYITQRTAVILALDKSLVKKIHIQTHTVDGIQLEEPLLWKYDLWMQSQERYAKLKANQDRDRDAGFVFDANVKNLTRAILKVARITDSQAQMCATKMVREQNWEGAKQLGLKKVITDVKEI